MLIDGISIGHILILSVMGLLIVFALLQNVVPYLVERLFDLTALIAGICAAIWGLIKMLFEDGFFNTGPIMPPPKPRIEVHGIEKVTAALADMGISAEQAARQLSAFTLVAEEGQEFMEFPHEFPNELEEPETATDAWYLGVDFADPKEESLSFAGNIVYVCDNCRNEYDDKPEDCRGCGGRRFNVR